MTVLVTGGAGYIGSHTVRLLRQSGERVVVLDSLRTGFRQAIGDTPLVVGDVGDARLVAEVLKQHEVTSIVHFAARKSVGESMEIPGVYFDKNVGGTLNLAEQARLAGVEHIVFSSSCSVYGTPEILPVDEKAPLGPESVYAQTKLMCEELLGWYGRCHGLRSVNLRYFNAAGASSDATIGEDWTECLNLIPLVMKAALGRRPPVQVFGTDYPTPDGTAIRDYIHVEDLADAHVRAIRYLRDGGATVSLNVGTGTGSSVKQVIDTTERIAGIEVPRSYTGRRPGDPVATYADNSLIRATLGWEPVQGLDEIVATAWAWHSTHLDGFRG